MSQEKEVVTEWLDLSNSKSKLNVKKTKAGQMFLVLLEALDKKEHLLKTGLALLRCGKGKRSVLKRKETIYFVPGSLATKDNLHC